jgi:hypothetical protein
MSSIGSTTTGRVIRLGDRIGPGEARIFAATVDDTDGRR